MQDFSRSKSCTSIGNITVQQACHGQCVAPRLLLCYLLLAHSIPVAVLSWLFTDGELPASRPAGLKVLLFLTLHQAPEISPQQMQHKGKENHLHPSRHKIHSFPAIVPSKVSYALIFTQRGKIKRGNIRSASSLKADFGFRVNNGLSQAKSHSSTTSFCHLFTRLGTLFHGLSLFW